MSATCQDCGEAMTGGYGQEMCWPCLLSDQLAETERKLADAKADAARAWAQAGCSAEALMVAGAQLERARADAAAGWAQAERYAEARLRLAAELEGATARATSAEARAVERWDDVQDMRGELEAMHRSQHKLLAQLEGARRWAWRWKAAAKAMRPWPEGGR